MSGLAIYRLLDEQILTLSVRLPGPCSVLPVVIQTSSLDIGDVLNCRLPVQRNPFQFSSYKAVVLHMYSNCFAFEPDSLLAKKTSQMLILLTENAIKITIKWNHLLYEAQKFLLQACSCMATRSSSRAAPWRISDAVFIWSRRGRAKFYDGRSRAALTRLPSFLLFFIPNSP